MKNIQIVQHDEIMDNNLRKGVFIEINFHCTQCHNKHFFHIVKFKGFTYQPVSLGQLKNGTYEYEPYDNEYFYNTLQYLLQQHKVKAQLDEIVYNHDLF